MYRLETPEFDFAYAHLLSFHKGKCSRLHGHCGLVKVYVFGRAVFLHK
jgi:6-pyruvoyl-tetrahydropterin synthase